MLKQSEFEPAPWLRNPHAQTVFASKFRPSPPLTVVPERLELDDGDFLDLSWLPERDLPADAPVVIVLHGLNGGLESRYARGLLRQVDAHAGRGLLLHFRGADKPNRLPNSYHSGETGDLGRVIGLLRRRYPGAPLAAVGYSLGGNTLLKYLGEQGRDTPLTCASAVSVPFDLAACSQALNDGLSRIYRAHLLAGIRRVIEAKFSTIESPLPLPDLNTLRDFRAFDSAVTAPLNGFASVDEYYARASSGPFLKSITTPTLIIQAQDDPFMGKDIIPRAEDLAPAIRFELSAHGGHVGFVAGGRLGGPRYWLENRIPTWLTAHLPGFVASAEEAASMKPAG